MSPHLLLVRQNTSRIPLLANAAEHTACYAKSDDPSGGLILDDMEKPAAYQIKSRGQLDGSWSDWFNAMTVSVEKSGDHPAVTTLLCAITDQAALHGILSRIRDLGLPLLLVRRLGDVDRMPEEGFDTP